MRSIDDSLLSDLLRMRGTRKLLVLRSWQIYHTIVKFTIVLSVLLRMRIRKKFLVWRSLPHFCQIYCTVINSIPQ